MNGSERANRKGGEMSGNRDSAPYKSTHRTLLVTITLTLDHGCNDRKTEWAGYCSLRIERGNRGSRLQRRFLLLLVEYCQPSSSR